MPSQNDKQILHARINALTTAIGTIVESEVPGGACDGARVTFTLAHAPIAGSLKVYLSGVRVTAFTLAGLTITMTVAPLATDSLLADYRYVA